MHKFMSWHPLLKKIQKYWQRCDKKKIHVIVAQSMEMFENLNKYIRFP